MNDRVFASGLELPGYTIPVLNERAIRAAAGLLFLFAMVAFMNAWLTGNFQPTRVFVSAFLIDFTLRLFVNPRYAPSLIVGEWIVRRQPPEWTGAPQKRFAWAIGFVLALTMFWLVVVQRVVGPVNILVCAACLALLFFETAFGICLGCKVYGLFDRAGGRLCPGGVCEVEPDPQLRLRGSQGLVLLAFVGLVFGVTQAVYRDDAHALQAAVLGAASPAHAAGALAGPRAAPGSAADAERCKVPEFAKAIGHDELWKRHNNCL